MIRVPEATLTAALKLFFSCVVAASRVLDRTICTLSRPRHLYSEDIKVFAEPSQAVQWTFCRSINLGK